MKNERALRTDANLKLDTSPDFVALLSSTLETAFSTFESKKDHTVVSPSCRSSIRATKQCLPTCALQIHFRSERAISFSGLWKVPQKGTRVVSWTSHKGATTIRAGSEFAWVCIFRHDALRHIYSKETDFS